MSKIFPITEFDSLTLSNSLQIFKSIIPFMDYDLQRRISTFIRANEFMRTLDFYKSPINCKCFKSCSSTPLITASSSMSDILGNDAIIRMIMKYCPEETENSINQFKNFSKMSDLFKNINPDKANGFVFDEKCLLNPAQQKLYNQYINQLDEMDSKKE